MAHPLPPDSGVNDLDTTAITNNAAVLDSLVLAAETLPVPLRPEDSLAKQAIFLGTVGSVVDGLGLLHLAVGPGENIVGRGQPDVHRSVVVDSVVDSVNHCSSPI